MCWWYACVESFVSSGQGTSVVTAQSSYTKLVVRTCKDGLAFDEIDPPRPGQHPPRPRPGPRRRGMRIKRPARACMAVRSCATWTPRPTTALRHEMRGLDLRASMTVEILLTLALAAYWLSVM
jgi:hypothetical protein